MKPTLQLTVLAAASAFFITSCAENPADDVPAAEVTDAAPEMTTPETVELEEPAVQPLPEAEEMPVAEAEAPTGTTIYTFTEESKIGFVGSKVTGSHEGGFTKFNGTFSIEGDKPAEGAHMLEIDMSSTWSDAEKLTGHLTSPDFFDVANFPTSKFTITKVETAPGDDKYTLSGDFMLHGVTKQISFPATIKKSEDGQITLDSEFAINRKDFDINYPGKADDLIRDEVVIKLAMVATAQ